MELLGIVAGNPGPFSSVEKMTFSNDSTSRIPQVLICLIALEEITTSQEITLLDMFGGTTPWWSPIICY